MNLPPLVRFAACMAVLGLLLASGCATDDAGAPTTLMNGSPTSELPVDLDGVEGPAVLTAVVTMGIGEIGVGSTIGLCVERAVGDRLSDPIVARVGVSGASVTFRSRSGYGLYGCDDSTGLREEGQKVCGVAFGQLSEGRLRDPRLNVGACTTKDGEPLGFAWVEPVRRARYVAVELDGYVEVYETEGGLPIRVTTNDVDMERSSAEFRVSEHTARGELIRRYRLEASVAG
jgi:hypothetical protein